MKEQWKAIAGYDGEYLVSNYGRVMSAKCSPVKVRFDENSFTVTKEYKPKMMTLSLNEGTGYLQVHLRKKDVSRQEQVHRLVAMAFLPNPSKKPHVDHIDMDKTNNRVSNLRWCTNQENHSFPMYLEKNSKGQKRSHKSISHIKRLQEMKKIKVVVVETKEVFLSAADLAEHLGVSRSAVTYAIKHKGKCKGLHICYAE